jgi:D-3-phosphoglycerate dehydrogenase
MCDEGLNDADLGIALSMGIEVVPTSHLGTTMIAEQSLALMLACSRQVLAAHQGRARSRPAPGILPMPIQLSGKTLGLIGVGPVGAELARMCRAAFGMRVVGYHPPTAPASNESGIVMMSSAREVCRAAEVIAVHLPATAAFEGLIDAELLTHCRPGAILVSTAEAGVISERALYSALQDATLAAAALDGVPGETPAQRRLLGLPNVSSTPTPAMASREAREAVSLSAAEAIHALLSPRARPRRDRGPATLAS